MTRRASNLLRFLALVAIHLVVALPFKAMNLIPGFSDVRPVTALGPVYAVFYGPLLVWLYWTRLSRAPFALRTVPDLLHHSLAVVAMALLETILITPAVALVYPSVDAAFFAFTVFANTAAFPILLGIPLAILLQEELGFIPLRREAERSMHENGAEGPRKRTP